MAASPVVPNDAKALISDPTATMCGNFINTLLKLPVVFYKLANWLLDSSGNFSGDAQRQVVPPGFVMASFILPPSGGNWLLCDGSYVNRADYPALFAAIGTAFDIAAGAGVFKLPDMRERFPWGWGTASIGGVGGEATHILTIAELPAHAHVYSQQTAGIGSGAGGTQGPPANTNTSSVGSGDPHNNLPPWIGVYWVIKS